MGAVVTRERRIVDDPRFVQHLLNNTAWSWIYVPIRLYLASVWIPSGWSKLNNPAWWQTGRAPRGFWERALADPDAVATGWYAGFLRFLLDSELHPLMGKLITLGELATGLGLLLGLFTGAAALGGALLNYNFLLAGAVSSNPILFVLELLVVAGWKVAGWWGLDRWVLPRLGVPWRLPRRAPPEGAEAPVGPTAPAVPAPAAPAPPE